jgi:hypothetical protein
LNDWSNIIKRSYLTSGSVETKMKYFRAFWPFILNVITLCVYVASVKNFYTGKINHILFYLSIPCMFGCMLIFPFIALVQLSYSLFLLYIKEKYFWLHLSSSIAQGICFGIFILLLSKGYFMTV